MYRAFIVVDFAVKNFRRMINPEKGFITAKSVYDFDVPSDKPLFRLSLFKGLSPVANGNTLALVSILINPFSIDQ